MSLLNMFATEFWRDLVWTLAHSLWQATAVAIVLGLILGQIPARKANLRYVLCVASLLLVVISSFFTHQIRKELRAARADIVATSHDVKTTKEPTPTNELAASASTLIDTDGVVRPSEASRIPWMSIAAIVWICGAALMLLRTCVSVFRANSLGELEPLDSNQHSSLVKQLQNQLGLKNAPRLWTSTETVSPYVVGVFTPVVVLPLSMLSSLTPTELQSVLAHEFAHIRRNDYLANLFQMVIEAAFFFNPAVWWISQQVRTEREACCDIAAVNASTSQVGYATILADWMEKLASDPIGPNSAAPGPAMAFAAKQTNGQPSGMLDRIRRILTPDHKPRLRVAPTNLVSVLVVSLLIGLGLNLGSQKVSAIAARALTHSERVATIQEERDKVKNYGLAFEAGKGTIRGQLKTKDGSIVNGNNGHFHSDSHRPGQGTSSTHNRFEDEFEIEVEAGMVHLTYFDKDYAPAKVGPITVTKGATINQDIMLEKGTPQVVLVTDSDGKPLANANVTLLPFSTGASVPTTTNDDGEATFPHTIRGRKSRLIARLDDYNMHRSEITLDGKASIQLSKAPLTRFQVVSATGEPVANAEIRSDYHRDDFNNHEKRVLGSTDEDGRFETHGLSSQGYYEMLVSSDQGRAIVDVSAGSETKVELLPGCDLEIRIEGDRDSLLSKRTKKLNLQASQKGAGVSRHHSSRDVPVNIIKETDDQLQLTLKGMWPGSFLLRAGGHSYHGAVEPGSHKLTLQVDELLNTAPSLQKKTVPVRIEFTLEGEPVTPGGELRLGHHYNEYRKLQDGVLEANVEPGSYRFEAAKLIGFTFEDFTIEVESNLDSEEEPQTVTIEVQPAGAISGTLVDADGQPIGNETVSCQYKTATSQGSLNNHFNTDSDGRFLLTPIPLNSTVHVKGGKRFNPAVSEAISIDAVTPKTDVTLTVPKSTTATVKVVDPDGEPLSGIPLSISLEHPDASMSWGGMLQTHPTGERKISPINPEYTYRVTANPRETFVSHSEELLPGETTTIQLRRGIALRGKVVDANGDPVANAALAANYEYDGSTTNLPPIVGTRTNAAGEFAFSQFLDRELSIWVSATSEYDSKRTEVSLPSEVEEPLVIELPVVVETSK